MLSSGCQDSLARGCRGGWIDGSSGGVQGERMGLGLLQGP